MKNYFKCLRFLMIFSVLLAALDSRAESGLLSVAKGIADTWITQARASYQASQDQGSVLFLASLQSRLRRTEFMEDYTMDHCADPSRLVFASTWIKSTGNQIFICRISSKLLSPEQMAATLLHELAHDIGVSDEQEAEKVREWITDRAKISTPWVMSEGAMDRFVKIYLIEVLRDVKKNENLSEQGLDPGQFRTLVENTKKLFWNVVQNQYLIRSHPELKESVSISQISAGGFVLRQ